MRMFLYLLLLLSIASGAPPALRSAYAQQPSQSYAPQTYAPHTWSPQTHTPRTWSPQTGANQDRSSPRRRLVKCVMSDDVNDYCVFYSDRESRRGSPCSCGGSRGRIN